MKKIDKNLRSIVKLQNENTTQMCLVYVNNFNYARFYFEEQQLEIVSELKFISAIVLNLPVNSLIKISSLAFVDFISSTATVMSMMDIANDIVGTKYLKGNGEDVCVCVIDTGIKTHADFTVPYNRIIHFENFVSDEKYAFDDNGHGTFVAGVCAGNGILSARKFCGVAPESKIVSVKALNNRGEANAVVVLEAMEWVYNNAKKYDIRVVCMSFGSEPLGINDPIMRGAEKLWKKGIVVVCAAGNSGPSFESIKSPGINNKIITVGAFDDNRIKGTYSENFFEIAKFSSRGPALNKYKPDVVAPGVDIVSCGISKDYTTLSGTSVATPIIAGLCAKILSLQKNLTPDMVKRIITRNTRPISYNKNMEGQGYTTFREKIKIL